MNSKVTSPPSWPRRLCQGNFTAKFVKRCFQVAGWQLQFSIIAVHSTGKLILVAKFQRYPLFGAGSPAKALRFPQKYRAGPENASGYYVLRTDDDDPLQLQERRREADVRYFGLPENSRASLNRILRITLGAQSTHTHTHTYARARARDSCSLIAITVKIKKRRKRK